MACILPGYTNTWDLEGYGNGPYLQLYGNTQESFSDYRAFRFEPATCPANNTLCDFRISMTSSLTTATCGQSVNFNVVCEGSGCQGVRYQWSGPGMDNQTGSSLNVTMPGTAGTYLYRVSALKTGCSDNGGVILAIPVYCNGQVCTPLSNGCYNIVSTTTGNRLQAMADNRVSDRAINNANNQIWRIDNRGNERVSFTVQDGTNRAMAMQSTPENFNIYTVVLGNYVANPNNQWSMQCNPANTTEWRVFSLRDNNRWDVTPIPNRDRVLEPALTTNSDGVSFIDYQKFSFQPITCPNTGNNCNFAIAPTASDGNSNRSCGQTVTLNANCSGSDCGGVSYSWSGNGISGNGAWVAFNVPNANGSYTYTVTASKAGCGNQAAPVTLNVSGCGIADPCAAYTVGTQVGYRSPATGDPSVKVVVSDASGCKRAVWSNGDGAVNRDWLPYITANPGFSLSQMATCLKFSDEPCGGRVGVAEPTEPETGLRLTVSPNPNTGQFTVRFQTAAGQVATLRLSDLNGRAVRPAQTIVGTGQVHQEAISLPAQVRGLLLLEVVSGGQRGTQKVLIE